MPLVGVNHRQPILHMYKIMVHWYSTYETINQFAICYSINPSLNCSKVFIVQVEKCLSVSFHSGTMETNRYCLKENNKCVMALIIVYENNGIKPKKVYRELSCVVYSLVDNYVCIDYLLFQSKTLSSISSQKTFEQTSFNILLGIGIPELLMNLVSCHGFMKKPNSTVILNCRYFLINDYLAKVF